jgi:hypothetical protein
MLRSSQESRMRRTVYSRFNLGQGSWVLPAWLCVACAGLQHHRGLPRAPGCWLLHSGVVDVARGVPCGRSRPRTLLRLLEGWRGGLEGWASEVGGEREWF